MNAYFIYADLLTGCIVHAKSTRFRTKDNGFFSVYFNIFSTSVVCVDKTADLKWKTKKKHNVYKPTVLYSF